MVSKSRSFILSFGLVLLAGFSPFLLHSGEPPKTIHVFVALCDNEHQGIIPVPVTLGNGRDPRNNLYWGARYGVKSFFSRSENWELLTTIRTPDSTVMERCIFKSKTKNAYVIADAYNGAEIKQTIIDFLQAASGSSIDTVRYENMLINAGGKSDLLAYIGHDGLMEFSLEELPTPADTLCRDVIILACMSKHFFYRPIRTAGAYPLLWTTGLMAPEAYTLQAAVDSWLGGAGPDSVRIEAAKAYDRYQNCGITAAKRLLVTGE